MRPKRPRDPFQLARQVFQEASGEAPQQPLPENDPATIAKRKGGVKGGASRASKLTPERRREIAQKAAAKRWKKDLKPPPGGRRGGKGGHDGSY